MKAITIWQPYASLIMLGLKTFETRSWGTNYRGPLIIHAAKKWDEERERDCVRVMNLLQDSTFSLHSLGEAQLNLFYLPMGDTLGKALGVVDLVACRHTIDGGHTFENSVGHFGPCRFGWKCSDPRIFREPIPCNGKQGLWTPDADLLASAKSLIRAKAESEALR